MTNHRLRSVFMAAGVLVLAAMGVLVHPTLAADPVEQAINAPVVGSANLSDYRLGPGDELRITVYGEKDLTGEFIVSGSGKLSFPLVGDVDAEGKTVVEVTAELRAKLADGYLVDPKVSGEVLNFRPYYVLGEVNKPGQYPYTSGLTALKAVATAQGYTYRANAKKIFIRHASESVEHEYSMGQVIYIQPGDTLRIAERYF